MHSLPLTPKRKQTKWSSIQLIAQNNNFPQNVIQNLEQKFNVEKPIKQTLTGTKAENGLPSLTTARK
jgi:hypothetical protein